MAIVHDVRWVLALSLGWVLLGTCLLGLGYWGIAAVENRVHNPPVERYDPRTRGEPWCGGLGTEEVQRALGGDATQERYIHPPSGVWVCMISGSNPSGPERSISWTGTLVTSPTVDERDLHRGHPHDLPPAPRWHEVGHGTSQLRSEADPTNSRAAAIDTRTTVRCADQSTLSIDNTVYREDVPVAVLSDLRLAEASRVAAEQGRAALDCRQE